MIQNERDMLIMANDDWVNGGKWYTGIGPDIGH
jgi:hypothetical protein